MLQDVPVFYSLDMQTEVLGYRLRCVSDNDLKNAVSALSWGFGRVRGVLSPKGFTGLKRANMTVVRPS